MSCLSLRARCLLAAGWILLSAALQAQPVTRQSSAEALARAALDGLPGMAAVGTLRNGVMRVAVHPAPMAGNGTHGAGTEPMFEIGSVSKVFTGLLLAQAVEKGELRLDDPIGMLLGKSVAFASRSTASITLRQLVTHTSCLRRLPENPNVLPAASQITSYTRQDLWAALGSTRIPRSPPCKSDYSNFGFAVLGELLAQRAGKPWEQLVKEQITGPLAMRDTFVTLPATQAQRLQPGFVREIPAPHWDMAAFAGAGGLRSTASDMLVFSKALMEGRKGPLGAAAERAVAVLEPYGTQSTQIGYAVMLAAGSEKVWAHVGITGGHLAEWIVWPDSGEAVIVLVSNLAAPARTIARGLVRDPRLQRP
jgi:D-alanyl-D-alanine-carboxypeptidase/D-alanyl-D-alanine-endopeptidase